MVCLQASLDRTKMDGRAMQQFFRIYYQVLQYIHINSVFLLGCATGQLTGGCITVQQRTQLYARAFLRTYMQGKLGTQVVRGWQLTKLPNDMV
jgi:hypothetical protein